MLEEMYEHPNKMAWRQFQEELDQHEFQIKISNQVIDIIEMGICIYSVDKTTVKYNKRSYSNNHPYVAPERVAELEDIIFKYCGWGAQGSTCLLEPLKKWKEWHLHETKHSDAYKDGKMRQHQFIFTYEISIMGETREVEVPFIITENDFGAACIKADAFVDETLHNFKTPLSTIRFVNTWDWDDVK